MPGNAKSVCPCLERSAGIRGGDLELNVSGIPTAVPQEMGAAISVPSDILHRVIPVTRGRRYSMVAWIHGPPFRYARSEGRAKIRK